MCNLKKFILLEFNILFHKVILLQYLKNYNTCIFYIPHSKPQKMVIFLNDSCQFLIYYVVIKERKEEISETEAEKEGGRQQKKKSRPVRMEKTRVRM